MKPVVKGANVPARKVGSAPAAAPIGAAKSGPPQKVGFLEKFIETDESITDLAKHRILPRLRSIQGSSKAELKDRFGEGSVIISPGEVLVAELGQPFLVVPIFFFVEYCLWSDIDDTVSPRILKRTFSPADPVALKAQNPNQRAEEYPSQNPKKPFVRRYVEHLNFACYLYHHEELGNALVTMQFHKGEYMVGQGFINACGLRKLSGGKTQPLWSQVWQISSARRERGGYNWIGLDYQNPEVGIIEEQEAEHFRGEYLSLKELFAKQRIVIDGLEDDDEPLPAGPAAGAEV